MPLPLRNVVLNEINNVIIALRTNSRFSSKVRFQVEIIHKVENKLLSQMKELRDKVLDSFESLKVLTILKPFFHIIESEETTGPITGVTLNSLKKFLAYPISTPNDPSSPQIIAEIIKCVKRCQFEATDHSTDESILIIILEVFYDCVISPYGTLLNEKHVFDIFKSCFRIGRETRQGENLRRNCEKHLMLICEYIFKQVLLSKNNTNKSHMTLLYSFICDLIDPLKEGKTGSLRLLGLSLGNKVLEIFGNDIILFPSLLKMSQDRYCRGLMRNTISNNVVILSQVLRGIENCIISLPNIHEQIESFLINTHLKIADGKNVDVELQELVLESLINILSYNSFPMYLYHAYDCYEFSSNLLENIVKFLSKNVKQSESLNSLHILSLKGLFQIVKCLHSRTLNSNILSHFDKEEIYLNKEFQEYRKNKTKKYQMMDICDKINKNYKKGLKMLQESPNFITKKDQNTSKEVAHFLFTYSKWLNKYMIGEILKEKKNILMLEEYFKLFDFQNLRIDQALRHAIYKFHLHGESQQVTGVLQVFSRSYYLANLNNKNGYLEDEDTTFRFTCWIMILHSDCHNKTNKRNMTMDTFIKTSYDDIFKNNKKKFIKKEELEAIYYAIEQKEMVFADTADEFRTDSNWNELLEKSKLFQNFEKKIKKKLDNAIFDCDVFESIWGAVAIAIRIVLENTKDPYIVQIAIDGFKKSARIANYYNLSKVFDKIVTSLTKFTLSLSPPGGVNNSTSHSTSGNNIEYSISVFGKNAKAIEVIKVLFLITRNYGDTVREGWRNILDLIIRVYELGLLKFSDKFWENENNNYNNRKNKNNKKLLNNTNKSGWFGIFSPQSDENIMDKEAIENTELCIASCRIPELLNEVKLLSSNKSLEYLLKGLILTSQKTRKINSVTFCLKLLVEITISKKDKMIPYWNYIFEHLESLFSTISQNYKENTNQMSKRGLVLLESLVNSIYRLCNKLYNNDKLLLYCHECFNLLKKYNYLLKFGICKTIKMTKILVRECGKFLAKKNKNIMVLFTIMKLSNSTSKNDEREENMKNSMDIVDELIKNELIKFPALYDQFVLTIVELFHNNMKIFEYLNVIHTKVFHEKSILFTWEESSSSTSPNDLLEHKKVWIVLLGSYTGLCLNAKVQVISSTAIVHLQRILLHPLLLKLSRAVLFEIINHLLLPLLDKLSKVDSLRDVRLKASSLISKAFLHFLPIIMKDIKQFDLLWLNIIKYMKMCMNIKCEYLIESTPQLVKNMILVMKSQGILSEGLWEKTKIALQSERELKNIIEEIKLLYEKKKEKKNEEEEEENDNVEKKKDDEVKKEQIEKDETSSK